MSGTDGPLLVDTGRGHTVFFQGRHLYSRYDPARIPEATVTREHILPETLVLCISPVLGYGLEKLLASLPAGCAVVSVERDQELFKLSCTAIPQSVHQHPLFTNQCVDICSNLETLIEDLPGFPFRRCVRLDLSAGSALYQDFYTSLTAHVDSLISVYWKNRVTLMQLGRNYFRNFFINLASLPASSPLTPYSVHKAILILASGPSLLDGLHFARKHRDMLFILAVDTAMPALREAGITPDACIILESQFWIEDSLLGWKNSRIPIFADLTALPRAIGATGGPVSFFFTHFTRSHTLSRFMHTSFVPPTMQRLGSVALTTVSIARKIAESSLPVFFAGLDFSWGNGYTHAQGTSPVVRIQNETNRIMSLALAGIKENARKVSGKNGTPYTTDETLLRYAALCREQAAGMQGVFDIGQSGLSTGYPNLTLVEADALVASIPFRQDATCTTEPKQPDKINGNDIVAFLKAEQQRILEIRSRLTGEHQDRSDAEERTVLLSKIAECDYLFLHFPDGHKGVGREQNFLNRVRVETEYFYKLFAKRVLG